MNEFSSWLRKTVTDASIASVIWRASLLGGLTMKQAQWIIMVKRGPLALEGINRLSPEAAGILALHDDDLLLPSLSEVSVGLAQRLARHRHGLYLDGCRSISPKAADALASHGLETVRKSAKEILAEWASWRESRRAAEFSCADDEPDFFAEAALKFLSLRFQTLSLTSLRTLEPSVAQSLGRHKGTLVLDGVRVLDDLAAEGLRHHLGSLDLNGLRWLTPPAARALAYCGGGWRNGLMMDVYLGLSRLRSISVEAATELASYPGTLSLNGLRELSPALAEALSRFSPQTSLEQLNLNGVRRLDPEAAREFARFEATLCLGGLTSISTALAEALVEVRGRLRLPGVRSLSSDAAEILLSRPDVTLVPSVG